MRFVAVMLAACGSTQTPAPSKPPGQERTFSPPSDPQPQSQPPDEPAVAPQRFITGSGFWCSFGTKGTDSIDQCYPNNSDCLRLNEIMVKSKYQMFDCRQQQSAACMTTRAKLDGKIQEECFSTLSACRSWGRDVARWSSEDLEVASLCGAVTYR
jgi:hypothetical protein